MSTVLIRNTPLPVVDFDGQRVVTLSMVDEVHQRPKGTAARNLRANESRFTEGRHLFKICADEFRRRFPGVISVMVTEDVTVLTERGYLILAKSLTDDLAWQVQEQLVDSYFRPSYAVAPALPQDYEEALVVLLGEVQQRKQLQAENQELGEQVAAAAPKVKFHDEVVVSHGVHYIREVAQAIGTGQNRLFQFLREKGWLDRFNVPYQNVIRAGYMVASPHPYKDPDTGERRTKFTPRVTGKGLVKIQRMWAERDQDLLDGGAE